MKVTAVMPEDLKDSLKMFADSKRWTMSQAVVYFIEAGIDQWKESDPEPKDSQAKS